MNQTVMVVEDDGDLREATAGLLRDHGFNVLVSDSGADALRQLRQTPCISAIVLDVEMPLMNGATFRGEQLADPQIAGIPLILLSGRADLGQIAAILGAKAFFPKPLDADALLCAVEACR